MGANPFATTTRAESPLDGSGGTVNKAAVSDFVTIQSLTNFAVMSMSISAAWRVIQQLQLPGYSTWWWPFGLCLFFGLLSFGTSWEGLKKSKQISWPHVGGAVFIAFINSLILTSAVIGATTATSPEK